MRVTVAQARDSRPSKFGRSNAELRWCREVIMLPSRFVILLMRVLASGKHEWGTVLLYKIWKPKHLLADRSADSLWYGGNCHLA